MESAYKRKMHVDLERLHLKYFSHKSFAECFPEKKNRQHVHYHTAYDYSIGLLQQYASLTLPVSIRPRSLNADVRNDWRPENDALTMVCRKLRNLSAGDRDLETISGKNGLLVVYQHLIVVYRWLLSSYLLSYAESGSG